MQTIEFGSNLPREQVLTGSEIDIRLPEPPRRYYRHGWQSWSLTAWVDPQVRLPIQKPHLLHPLQLDPAHVFDPHPHGSWVGAAEMADGHSMLLGSLGVDARVILDGNSLKGVYDAEAGQWYLGWGERQTAFAGYASKLGEVLGRAAERPAPRVWCSWYGLYTAIDEGLLARVLTGLGDLPFDVFQVDDGWQRAVGDWEPSGGFPSGMETLAQRIKSTGRRAGLWLAPLIATSSSRLFHAHPEWFLCDQNGRLVSAGINWGEQLHALDTTLPEVSDWLVGLMQQVRRWGYDYLKLDFLYGGALPGKRNADVPREAAYRGALQALRKGMGEDAYFVACGAPIVPSLGLCDALRTSVDVGSGWESERDSTLLHNPSIPGTRNAIRNALNRMWLAPLVRQDPDVVYFRSVECSLSKEQKRLFQALALICGFKATSDLPQWLSGDEREELRAFLLAQPRVEQAAAYRFRLDGIEFDFTEAMEWAPTGGAWNNLKSMALGWVADHRLALKLDHWLGQRALKRVKARLESQF